MGIVIDTRAGRFGARISALAMDYYILQKSMSAIGPAQHPIQWILFREEGGRGVRIYSSLLVLSLRKSGAIPPLVLYAFMTRRR